MKKANNAGESVKGFKEKLEQNNKDLKIQRKKNRMLEVLNQSNKPLKIKLCH